MLLCSIQIKLKSDFKCRAVPHSALSPPRSCAKNAAKRCNVWIAVYTVVVDCVDVDAPAGSGRSYDSAQLDGAAGVQIA